MNWQTVGLWIVAVIVVLTTAWVAFYYFIKLNFYNYIFRIFQEEPLFFAPRGYPVEDAEDVRFPTADGLTLAGSYLPALKSPRRGVIVFGGEFKANRWGCIPYCQFLREAGFDVFAFDPRCHGDSDEHPGYQPLHWVTTYDVEDFKAALNYLKTRRDRDPNGVGFFGISKGGSAGLLAAADDPYVRCAVTDGCFGNYSTMLPFMRKWLRIYSEREWLQAVIPDWYYLMFARKALREIERQRNCRFAHLEKVMSRIAPRPLFMIHGAKDSYIRPEAALTLFHRAGEPKEIWLVPKAKHNQALQADGKTYRQRILEFFCRHLKPEPLPESKINSVPIERTDKMPVTAE